MENVEQPNLEKSFQSLFGTRLSGTGEEELLRLATTFSVQLSARQVRILMYINFLGDYYTATGEIKKAAVFHSFVRRYIEYKQYNNSDVFVMRALDSIALRKFMNENTFKVQVEK